MALTLRDGRSGWIDRLREAFMGLGVVVLLGGAISAAVVGAVALLHAARDKEKRAAPAPILQRPALPPGAAPPGAFRPPQAAPPAPVPDAPAAEVPGMDSEGFIRHWLILGPFPFERPQTGKVELARKRIKEEGKIRPVEGQRVSEGGREYVWMAHRAPEYYVDFLRLLGAERGEDAAAYAACYVLADEEIKGVRLRMGSNDQAKVWLNGKEVVEFTETRTLQKDQNVSEEAKLRKGGNFILFKVVNEKQNWQGCLRLTDRAGAPPRGIRVSLVPP